MLLVPIDSNLRCIATLYIWLIDTLLIDQKLCQNWSKGVRKPGYNYITTTLHQAEDLSIWYRIVEEKLMRRHDPPNEEGTVSKFAIKGNVKSFSGFTTEVFGNKSMRIMYFKIDVIYFYRWLIFFRAYL